MSVDILGSWTRVLSSAIALWAMTPSPAFANDDSTLCLLVPQARVVLHRAPSGIPIWLKNLQAANYGHEIEAGHHDVLSIRRSIDDGLGVDGEKFAKLTIELAKALSMSEAQQKIEVLHSYYTEESVGFV